jgi:hypothetical protein
MTQAATLAQLASSGALSADTSGNVGIGTTTPTAKLAVSGSILTVADTSSLISIGRYTSGFGGAAISTNGGATFLAGQVEGVDQFRATSTGLFQFNSGYGSVATAYGCRAWVNFNGTGTVAIRASGNVTSITDNGTGDYTVNFTTAMPDTNYCVNGIVQFNQSGNQADHYLMAPEITNSSNALLTGSVRVVGKYAQSVSTYDMTTFCVSIFR